MHKITQTNYFLRVYPHSANEFAPDGEVISCTILTSENAVQP